MTTRGKYVIDFHEGVYRWLQALVTLTREAADLKAAIELGMPIEELKARVNACQLEMTRTGTAWRELERRWQELERNLWRHE